LGVLLSNPPGIGGEYHLPVPPPVAIDVSGLSKTFQIPGPRAPFTLRERLLNPTGRTPGRSLEVLKDISFDVKRGEHFGIVGRNGSGKSTLLKVLASVYRADRGRIRIAGRLAPFLELGVGFNAELPAADNVILNGVMMGLSPRVAKQRVDEIIDFAGLNDYTDLLIKNYSSGMKVRLAFAVMTHVDADVLLMDEVLAVGDAEFQEKCAEVFERMREEERTMVLVTHAMDTVAQHCERAMLIDDGRIDTMGDPDDVAERYYEVNLKAALAGGGEGLPEIAGRMVDAVTDPAVAINAVTLRGHHEEKPAIPPGESIEFEVKVRVLHDIADAGFHFQIANGNGQMVFASPKAVLGDEGAVRAGEVLAINAEVENRLPPGRYVVTLGVSRGPSDPAGPTRSVRFEVIGERRGGMFDLEHRVSVESGSESLVG